MLNWEKPVEGTQYTNSFFKYKNVIFTVLDDFFFNFIKQKVSLKKRKTANKNI